jgi:hypothetical protein
MHPRNSEFAFVTLNELRKAVELAEKDGFGGDHLVTLVFDKTLDNLLMIDTDKTQHALPGCPPILESISEKFIKSVLGTAE